MLILENKYATTGLVLVHIRVLGGIVLKKVTSSLLRVLAILSVSGCSKTKKVESVSSKGNSVSFVESSQKERHLWYDISLKTDEPESL